MRPEKWVNAVLLLAGLNLAPARLEGGQIFRGVRAGTLLARTELDDGFGGILGAFLRRPLGPAWESELHLGYGRLAGANYAASLGLVEMRFLFSPLVPAGNSPYLYGGFGMLRYSIEEWPAARTPGAPSSGWSAVVPGGMGVRFRVAKHLVLEVSGGYTYTLEDQLNGAALKKGNDGFWNLMLGLKGDLAAPGRPPRTVGPPPSRSRPEPVSEQPLPEPVSEPPLPEPASLASPDGDDDGLSDRDETRVHFTNPRMPDSDSDGLKDGDEVQVYQTNPNQADTDSGGVRDGDEVARGTSPLDPADDAIQAAPREMVPLVFPIVYFPSGGTTLAPAAREQLDEVAQRLGEHPEIELELRGYSDSIGRRADNLRLSQRRAEVVRAYLVQQGINRERLRPVGFGEDDPIAPNTTREGRQQNRRVELVPR